MNLLNVENVTKSYSEKQLLKNISLGINEGDKIGILGINGTGKTTLLKIIAGVESPDNGRIVKGNSVRIEYLMQDPYFDKDATVIDQVFKGNSESMKVMRKYQEAITNADTSSDVIMKLTQSMDSMNLWNLESEAKAILTKLGIVDFGAKVGTLSGGQKKRIALASALINPSDLLILDEPTNHLDDETIEWLEDYLNNRKGSLLMITHDRYFLDRVVNEIVEIDSGNIYVYKGNYNDFLEKKAEREELESSMEKKRQSLYKKELAWIRKGAKARTTKQKARIDRFEKLKDSEVNLDENNLEISVATSRLGKKVVELENISKSFEDKKVIDDFSYIVLRDDRVGIVGPNGSGKSTLINIICGKIVPDSGVVEVGETVKMGVFSQETYHMDDSLRVIEYIREGAEYVTTGNGDKISASQMLERFLFPPNLQWTPISKLSGGEKRRLYLLRVLMESPNVLLLDEPTNDLDIQTLTILEDYLEGFKGAVIAVSHDRYFLDKLSQKIFVFEGNGKIVEYTGNYTSFKEKNKNIKINSEDLDKITKSNESNKENSKDKKRRQRQKTLKFTFKEQKEYEEIDDVIANLEEKISEMDEKLKDAATDYVLLQELFEEKEKLEKEYDEKMKRWVYLNELDEKIKNNR